MISDQPFLEKTEEACEHTRFYTSTDDDLFVIDMVKRQGAEVREASTVGYIVCPYCETAYQIREGAEIAVKVDPETGIATVGPVTIEGEDG